MTLRHVFSFKDLGADAVWLLVQQARGIPDARAHSTFLEDKTAVLLFAQESFPERLCITAAIRQMSGHVVYLGSGSWRDEVHSYPTQMSQLVSYYVDCAFVFGLPLAPLRASRELAQIPVINAGSPDGMPLNVLADLACMYKHTDDFSAIRVAWLGCANGTLNSLIEATEYFPFELRIAVPHGSGPDEHVLAEARSAGRRVSVVESREEAVRDAHYLYAGCSGGTNDESAECRMLGNDLMRLAAPNARILLSTAPSCSTPVENGLLQSKASLLPRQAENRLRIHKRLLHWIFDNDQCMAR